MIKSLIFKNATRLFWMALGALVLGAFLVAGTTFAATGTVDLTDSVGPGASFIGMPRHGAWCTDLAVPEADQAKATATFPVYSDDTEVRSVSTNYGEVWTSNAALYGPSTEGAAFALSGTTGTATFNFGVSGTVKVCFGPKVGATKFGKFGLGVPPTAKDSALHYVDGTPYSFSLRSGQHHGVRNLNLQVDADATAVKVTRVEGTGVEAWLRYKQASTGRWLNVTLDVACAANVCTISAPKSAVFGDFATKPYITLAVWWDATLKAEEPNVIGLAP